VQQVGGDVRAYQVDGITDIRKADGDVKLSLAGENVSVFTHGDIRVGLAKTTGQTVQLSAHGDVKLMLPEGASATLDLASRHENIRVRLGDRLEVLKEEHFDLALGDGSTKVKVEADGDVLISDSKAEIHHEHHDFDGLGHHIEEQIERTTEMAQTRAAEAAERSARRAEEKMRHATERIQRRTASFGFPFEAAAIMPNEPAPAPAPAPKASEEERMLILKMLQEKKITVEEADKLFEVLEP
jgi:hypothetical protein